MIKMSEDITKSITCQAGDIQNKNIDPNCTQNLEASGNNSGSNAVIQEDVNLSFRSSEQNINIDEDHTEKPNNISAELDNPETFKRGYEYLDETLNKLLVERVRPEVVKRKTVEIYADNTGPQMYDVKGNLVTPPIICKNLPEAFEYLPIFGKPKSKADKEQFIRNKIRDFVGCDLSDEAFDDLEKYCSPDNLKTGKELCMRTKVPIFGLLTDNIINKSIEKPETEDPPPNLFILKKLRMRMERDTKSFFNRKLKYRGTKLIPISQEEENEDVYPSTSSTEPYELEPGKDIIYRVRVYRPYLYGQSKDRFTRTRHGVFSCDIVVCGRQLVSVLRDRFVCHNDFDMRVDVSDNPDVQPDTKAKEVFPSGFLFINNVFYVDTREGCIDYSEPIRKWALRRGLGNFPKRDMCAVTIDQLVIRLGYPDVYVHQGNCEHVFIFSEVRLLNINDPLRLSQYPYSSALGQNQSTYCTTCAEFCAKWIVVGCLRVPFDPAFFCDTCFKLYLYKDGEKIGNFKAYSYRGNALNMLKPQ